MNYRELRSFVQIQSHALPATHPCIRGNAVCCESPDVPVSPEDRAFITDAVTAGAIPTETVRQAKRNLGSQNCPFLGKNRECTIYEHRPLVCIVTGIGGLPKPEATKGYLEQVDRYYRTEEDSGFPVAKTDPSMCEPCTKELIAQKERFTLFGMETMQVVGFHYQAGSQPISKYVRTLSRRISQKKPRR